MRLITVTAPAKVNLHLAVGAVRVDGYHELTGVFHALELADQVALRAADTLRLECDVDLGVPAHRNIAYGAAMRMAEAFDRAPAVSIRLTKRIPHGAGLGGGSSDAAAVIAGLAAMWGIDAAHPRLLEVARVLGADVAFFLEPGGAAVMTGRGDVVDRPLPALAGAPALLVRPELPVSTAAAYAAFDAEPTAPSTPVEVVAALEAGDVRALAHAMANNLESASMKVVPAVADALAWTRGAPGVLGAVVAGSGSAVFALVESTEAGARLARDARAGGWWSVATRLADHGARVIDMGGVS